MQDLLAKLQEYGALYGLQVVGALLVFLIGRIIARVVRGIVRRVMERRNVAPILVSFVSQISYVLLMVFVVLAALGQLGVRTTSAIAVLGAAGLAVGLALQGSLANFAAGLMLVIFRPFKAGHFIEAAGVSGTVEDLGLFTTQVVTPDNRTVIIPNGQVTGGNIVNFSAKGTRRVDLVVGIAYEADIAKAKGVIMGVLGRDERVLKEPAPFIGVLELADSSVNLAVRPWTTVENYWGVYFDTLEAVKDRLDAEGIGIPFPQRDVHLFREAAGD